MLAVFYSRVDSKTREHWLKVRGERTKRVGRGNLFIRSVVHIWNVLPEETVKVDTTFQKTFGQICRSEWFRKLWGKYRQIGTSPKCKLPAAYKVGQRVCFHSAYLYKPFYVSIEILIIYINIICTFSVKINVQELFCLLVLIPE